MDRIRVRDRECGPNADSSSLRSFSPDLFGLRFVLIAGVYLVLRIWDIPKSLLYRGFGRSIPSPILLALYTLTKMHSSPEQNGY